ncbi:hypothetical protein F5884DRAFT_738217 [Xylogone sp. PMI_703]|nr:hypothetical protein F5884DRAFT_738217 [Xylogone sp. PMI_703]
MRPRYRYWIPDASIDPDKLADDIHSIGQIGAGGIEFLPFYLYGGEAGTDSPDWSIYGYGLPDYNKILKTALEATRDSGLIMDLCFGPQSGQGVPAEIGNPGLAWQVTSYNATVQAGSSFDGVIPGFGSGILQSVVTARLINSTQHSDPAASGGVTEYMITYYAASTLTEVTSMVQQNGHLKVDFQSDPSDATYVIIASYSSQSYNRACTPGVNPQNFLQNGSFAVDHFSTVGAKVTTDFLEQYVLVNGVKELLEEVGNYVWEDSIEIFETAYWSPDLPAVFEQMHEYSISKYIPLLAIPNGASFVKLIEVWYRSDEADTGQRYIDDFRETLTYMYSRYMSHFVDWAHDYLNLQYSCQPDGVPIDRQTSSTVPDAPEGETLGFNNNIDIYKTLAGPANLAGRRIISCELGANTTNMAYQTTLTDLVDQSNHAFAGGSNQMVIHGATYSHDYYKTLWPGYTSFSFRVSEEHSRCQPAWEVGYPEVMDWMARTQYILQTGTPKRDIVFVNKLPMTGDRVQGPVSDILPAGYSYEYLSPDNLAAPEASVNKKVLAIDGPAYKAMVIMSNATLTSNGILAVYSAAKDGLPVIFYGGIPASLFGTTNSSTSNAMQSVLREIQLLKNVQVIESGTLSKALKSAGVTPSAQISSNGSWWTNWRQDPATEIDYVYVYNESPVYSEGSINFATKGIPYLFDSWTGERSPVLNYTRHPSSIELAIKLAGRQTIILAFSPTPLADVDLPDVYFIQTPDSIIGFSHSKDDGLIAKTTSFVTERNSIPLVTSDHHRHAINAPDVPSSFTLGNYKLTVEHWDAPSNLSDADAPANKYNTTLTLPSLLPWTQIPGLLNTSGIGYYSTSFSWPPPGGNMSLGAIIDFGSIIQSVRVSINGKPLPTLDHAWARTDITKFLKAGENTIEAKVATNMLNGLRPIWSQMMTSGGLNTTPLPSPMDMGLVDEVVVTPYAKVVIK